MEISEEHFMYTMSDHGQDDDDKTLQNIRPLKIDPSLLEQLSRDCNVIAKSLTAMMEDMQNSLGSLSGNTLDSIKSYAVAIEDFSDTSDHAMTHMTQLISICEELDDSMPAVYELQKKIKTVKKQLDILENLCR